MLTDVKTALRITHTKLDNEIQVSISTAKAELARVGVTLVDETDPLIADAIKTFCKYSFASDIKVREGFFESWQYQMDSLRRSKGYGWEDEDDV